MPLKINKNKNSIILLIIIVVSVIPIILFSSSYFSHSNSKLDAGIMTSRTPEPSASPENVVGTNETNISSATPPFYKNNSSQLETNNTSSANLISTAYNVQYLPRVFSPPNNYLDQIAASNLVSPTNETNTVNEGNTSNHTSTNLNLVPIYLNESDFATYTYGGYLVQQANATQFIFPFPNCTDQGQLSGSDALTPNNFTIQRLDFNSTFIAPNINALGFDEMAIFATSNANTYKGTEFGVRMDLQNGSIYGYVQEPNESIADVSFNMVQLMPNDGLMHHYTLVISGSNVSFNIDDVNYGLLNYPSNTDYSNLNFSMCEVVHRFTDGWDSNGDMMISGNFVLNQQ